MPDLTHLSGGDLLLSGIALATGLATLLGGMLALRLKTSIGLLAGFGAGAVLGVALFDLLPEALRLGEGRTSAFEVAAALASGFAAYLLIARAAPRAAHENGWRGHMGAAAITLHSLLDGLGIGLAFQVSSDVGLIVAVAVLAHDCVDGANTVALSLSGGAGAKAARAWLAADVIAPMAGIGLSSLIRIPEAASALLLAVFAGFFLYVGASELVPDAHERRPRASTSLATMLGLGFLYLVVRLSSGSM